MSESNDLRFELDQDRKDEIGALALCLNTFVHKLHDILMQNKSSAERVAEVTEEISLSAKGQAQGAGSQNDQASQVATAMQQMSATVMEVSENSNRAADAARKASETREKKERSLMKRWPRCVGSQPPSQPPPRRWKT
jgi:methyl-accepting chemotaxis protein